MARSPLTLAASVTSALPRVSVVGVGLLTEGAAGRYDSALAELEDGRRVVVRVATDAEAAAELAAEARALRALTPGVRALLPFQAPELLGETDLGAARAVVVDFLPGYRVDAVHLPPGRGAATSIGEALAAVHALPPSIVRTEGLAFRTPQQVRDEVVRLLDRVQQTRSAPPRLLERWRRAAQNDQLWRFESAVVLGGAAAASFLFQDLDEVPTVTGLLDWHGLQVGDPATDLQWLASAPGAAEDVFAAYVARSGRAPDGLARERARLYAELEFAKWLVHGHEEGRDDIVQDAVKLLESLETGVRDGDIVPEAGLGVDEAIALLGRVPDAPPTPVDTSMHTDAYDPEELALWLSDDGDTGEGDTGEDDAGRDGTEWSAEAEPGAGADERSVAVDADSTGPIDISEWAPRTPSPAVASAGGGSAETADAEADAQRSSDAALRRWLSD